MAKIVSRTVSVYPFRLAEGAARYLLLRRALGGKKLPGAWQAVHGHVEKGEHTRDAARRELIEETGLTAATLWPLDYVERFHDPRKDRIELVPCYAARVEGAVTLSREHDEARWLSLDGALALCTFRGQREALAILAHDLVAPLLRGDGSPDPQ